MSSTAIHLPVATADSWTPSRRMQSAAAAERERVERELLRLSKREDSLAHELDAIREARSALQDELVVLQRLSRDLPAGEIRAADERRRLRVVTDTSQAIEGREVVLRGAQIRETAVRVLASSATSQAVHYRTWFELLRRAGFVSAGKDPLATFLTQIGRSPVVRRSTAPGMYSLDLHSLERERAHIAQLRAKLAEVGEMPPEATVDDIARIRESRSSINAEIASAERTLGEILRSLDVEEGG
jgi:vacuolar-type H+-ATPase subunit I/STV1